MRVSLLSVFTRYIEKRGIGLEGRLIKHEESKHVHLSQKSQVAKRYFLSHKREV